MGLGPVLSVRKKMLMPSNAFSSLEVAFWREVCGNNEKIGSRAPSCQTLLVAGSAHTGSACTSVKAGRISFRMWKYCEVNCSVTTSPG